MAVYAIGDIQGCYDDLRRLLDRLDFDPSPDCLWLVGDLVNRGPQSLETLRFVRGLGQANVTVLGNHDLTLIALHAGIRRKKSYSSLKAVLDASDCDELIHWLRHRPLLHHDSELGFTMVHAGIVPQWDLVQAMRCADEVEQVLRSQDYHQLLPHMFGDYPEGWSDNLEGWDRLRFIINVLTRLRYCDVEGRIDTKSKGPPGTQPKGLMPWFKVPNRKSAAMKIVCGHWSTLGFRREAGVIALDSGCVWGGELTAVRLDREGDLVQKVQCRSSSIRS